ncbi:helix-turn-helix domain-containing protein [Mycobacterium sp. Root265]|uniref:helix-turn-helix domain-containing protein n=1 Tax=Mycobacterium sp. Root265 TaxID=1736504 RepID=UPI00138F301D|nr:helix-turn-helix transcriptional regulator [Mycobacterium sp. Root265]
MDDDGTPDMHEQQALAEKLQRQLTSERSEASAANPAQRRQVHEDWEKSFGDNVRHWRRERNWSQEDLADKLRSEGIDLHQTSVAKIERGTRPLRVAEAAAIATIFRVPPLAVFVGSPQTDARSPINQLNDMIAAAQVLLNDMKADMSRSAGRYVEQEAHVLALARILNQTALDAEKRQNGHGTANEGGQHDAEA